MTLRILDVPFAVPLAILFGFFDLIPLVGATLGGILVGIVVAFVDFPVGLIVWVAVLILYQQIENNLIQPFVYGRGRPAPPADRDRRDPDRRRAARRPRRPGRDPGGRRGAGRGPRLLALPAAARAPARSAPRPAEAAKPAQSRSRHSPRLELEASPGRARTRRPTPIIPGPTWAPITGPTSDTNTGSEPKISRHSLDQAPRRLGVLDVLDDPGVGAVGVALARVLDQPLEGAPSGAHALDRA